MVILEPQPLSVDWIKFCSRSCGYSEKLIEGSMDDTEEKTQ